MSESSSCCVASAPAFGFLGFSSQPGVPLVSSVATSAGGPAILFSVDHGYGSDPRLTVFLESFCATSSFLSSSTTSGNGVATLAASLSNFIPVLSFLPLGLLFYATGLTLSPSRSLFEPERDRSKELMDVYLRNLVAEDLNALCICAYDILFYDIFLSIQ